MGTNDNLGQAWDDARKSALVAQIVSGELTVKAACARHRLSAETIQAWVRVFRRTTLQALDDHLRQTFMMQGADAASLGSAEYTGTLADIPLADLIQTFQMGAKDGVISVTAEGRRSRIWCDRGLVVDAESGRLRGEAAVYRILGLERGQVFADFRGEPRERSIELPCSLLLLEAARRKDESVRVIEKLGGLRGVYRAVATASEGASPLERELLGSCDGRRSLGAVLEQSESGDLETLEAALALVERGALVRHGTLPPASAAALVVSRDTPATTVSRDIMSSMVSLSPLAASHRPETRRGPRAAPLAAIGLLLALGAVGWGFMRSRPAPSATRAATVLVPPPAPAPSAPSAPARETYLVESSAEPAHAELWLDGLKVGVGRLRRELLRDGQAHSLRIVAEGYAPTTLLFADAPPPSRISLEKLSAPPPTPPSPAAAQLPGASSPASRVRRAGPASAPRARPPVERAPAPAASPAPIERAPAAPAPPPPSPPSSPSVEATTPVIRVID